MDDKVDWIHAVPAQLNEGIKRGSIDLAPISSFAYGQDADDYVLLSDLSVSALGKVRSILLFHKGPIDQLDGKRVALTNTSATSLHLLKIILHEYFNIRPEYTVVRPQLQQMLADADAALLIGDDAIRAKWGLPEGYNVTDLGELWEQMTGEWMSFALWAVRKETAERYPDQLEEVHQAFIRSKQKMLQEDHSPVIKQAVEKIGGTAKYWRTYFAGLSHELGQRQQRGLTLYYRYAYEHGYFQQEPRLQVWEGNSYPAQNEC